MREQYREITFKKKTLQQIERINAIIEEYLDAGYTLTVRQLYYQLVARDIIPNNEKSYKQTTSIVNDARVAGLIDWDAIEDRTRAFEARGRWNTPNELLTAAARQYHTDPWATQDKRLFLVVEKEALSGVFQRVCREFDVPLLAARGYPSASVVREFAKTELEGNGTHDVIILHFGDHDPSGIDMTRDIRDRLSLFVGRPVEIVRLALNMEQVEEYDPPPNPAKTTDSRFEGYMQEFGEESWELDALSPNVIAELIEREVEERLDMDAWEAASAREEEAKETLQLIADRYEDVAEFVKDAE